MGGLSDDRPAEAAGLTHLDERGAARMVDVWAKAESGRVATAGCRVLLAPATLELLAAGGLPKGDALALARVAGIMGAKRTPDLIPLCHPLPLTSVRLQFAFVEAGLLRIDAVVRVFARTGVEMEAMTAVSVAALTVYDMCKSVDRDMVIERVRLEEKSGGRSGNFRRKD